VVRIRDLQLEIVNCTDQRPFFGAWTDTDRPQPNGVGIIQYNVTMDPYSIYPAEELGVHFGQEWQPITYTGKKIGHTNTSFAIFSVV
jgi:hypothetical protein